MVRCRKGWGVGKTNPRPRLGGVGTRIYAAFSNFGRVTPQKNATRAWTS